MSVFSGGYTYSDDFIICQMSGVDSVSNTQPSKLAQFMDEDLSNTYRISQDLDISLNRQKVDQVGFSV